MWLFKVSLLLGWAISNFAAEAKRVCTVKPAPNGGDSAPAIIDAFSGEKCGKNGKVVFKNETYHVASVMNTTGLENCEVEVHGTLLVRPNTSGLGQLIDSETLHI